MNKSKLKYWGLLIIGLFSLIIMGTYKVPGPTFTTLLTTPKAEIHTTAAGDVGLLIDAYTGHTANLLQIRDPNDNNLVTIDKNGDLTTSGVIRGGTSLWWRAEHFDIFSASVGASGATWVAPDANILGGYRLDAAGEYIYISGEMHSDWDGASDIEVKITFELSAADPNGAGGGDRVDISLLTYYKGETDVANKTQTVEVSTNIDGGAQYQLYVATFTLDWDKESHVIEVGDKFALRPNLETDTSTLDDITISHVHIRYKSALISPEI